MGLNLYQKLAAISGELGAITKDSQAPQEMGGYRFMSHGALMGHLREKLAERNIAILESLAIVSDETITLKTKNGDRPARRLVVQLSAEFVNGDEPDERHQVQWFGEGLDTSDKALQKAATSAEKYLLSKTFKVSDKDDPDGSESAGELATQKPAVSSLQTKAAKPHLTLAQQIAMICNKLGIERSHLIKAVTGKEHGRDLTREEALQVLAHARALENGTHALVGVDGEWSVVMADLAQPSQVSLPVDGETR